MEVLEGAHVNPLNQFGIDDHELRIATAIDAHKVLGVLVLSGEESRRRRADNAIVRISVNRSLVRLIRVGTYS